MSGLESNSKLRSVVPYFTVVDADRLINFIQIVFGGKSVKLDRRKNGSIQHARVLIGDTVLMINEANSEFAANVSQMYVFVADVEGAFTAALDEGATPLMQPNQRPHGDRMAGFNDPCGNIWWVACSEAK
ncbi:MAG: hypothetical protein KTR18_01790 [Acidiferrobacterales bacterium]|nr:hypothetical protein [Acidiferrobacterales bacterium]